MLNQHPNQSALVGKKVFVKDGKDSFYAGHHGFVKSYEGDGMYTLHNGSLGDMEPLLHRSEFTVHREKKPVQPSPQLMKALNTILKEN